MSPADAKAAAAGIASALLRMYVLDDGLGPLLDSAEHAPDAPAFDGDEVRRAFVDLQLELCKRAGVRACRICACTESLGCIEGCSWVEEDLCSSCATPASEPRILVVSR